MGMWVVLGGVEFRIQIDMLHIEVIPSGAKWRFHEQQNEIKLQVLPILPNLSFQCCPYCSAGLVTGVGDGRGVVSDLLLNLPSLEIIHEPMNPTS